MGWVGCSGAGSRPQNRVCGAEIPIGVFPCPWGMPSSVNRGNCRDPMGVTQGSRPFPGRARGNRGALGEAAQPGAPTGSTMLANPHPASLPASANGSGRSAGESRHVSADAHTRASRPGGCGLGPAGPRGAEPGRTGAGRCHGGGGGGSGMLGCPAGSAGAVPLCSVSLAQVCWPWAT